MVSPASMPQKQRERIGVFIDYENTRRNAAYAFLGYGAPRHAGVIDPVALAEAICRKRTRPSTLGKVFVYRGRPSTQHQPVPASYFDRHASQWSSSNLCEMKSRDLKYRFHDDGSFTAQEKGIDVWLATDLIASSIAGSFDAVVVVSTDTDLLPAVEYVLRDTPTHIEIASWSGEGCYPLYFRGQSGRRKIPYCHYLSKELFEQICQDEE